MNIVNQYINNAGIKVWQAEYKGQLISIAKTDSEEFALAVIKDIDNGYELITDHDLWNAEIDFVIYVDTFDPYKITEDEFECVLNSYNSK